MRQKGFTLIELLVVMAVGGILLMGVVLAIYQVTWGTGRTNSQVTALTDINYATLWIKKDLEMSQKTDLNDGYPYPQDSVTLTWTDYTTSFEPEGEPQDHSCSYALSGTELLRTYDGTVNIIGRHIMSLGFTQDGRVINVVITASEGSFAPRSETLEFSVYMRSEETQ